MPLPRAMYRPALRISINCITSSIKNNYTQGEEQLSSPLHGNIWDGTSQTHGHHSKGRNYAQGLFKRFLRRGEMHSPKLYKHPTWGRVHATPPGKYLSYHYLISDLKRKRGYFNFAHRNIFLNETVLSPALHGNMWNGTSQTYGHHSRAVNYASLRTAEGV